MVSFHIQNNEENGFQIGNSNSRNSAAAGNSKKEEKLQIKNGRVFAGNSNLPQDPVALKRIKAGKDAMKGVIEKFTSDKKTDDNLVARKQHIQELQAENDESTDQLNEFNELKNHLKEEYEISDDSQEQKDLELLVKEMNSHKKGAPKLTIEEQKQFESMGPQTEYQEYDLKFGKMTIACNKDGITYVGMGCGVLEHAHRESTRLLDTAAQQLEEYFQGKRQVFDVPISPIGTLFQRKVWEALCTIPYGETRSYKQIAEMAGNPKACRAVGMANNRNHIMIIIPCHRVIGTNGSLVGYGGGLELKEKLLKLEKKNKG